MAHCPFHWGHTMTFSVQCCDRRSAFSESFYTATGHQNAPEMFLHIWNKLFRPQGKRDCACTKWTRKKHPPEICLCFSIWIAFFSHYLRLFSVISETCKLKLHSKIESPNFIRFSGVYLCYHTLKNNDDKGEREKGGREEEEKRQGKGKSWQERERGRGRNYECFLLWLWLCQLPVQSLAARAMWAAPFSERLWGEEDPEDSPQLGSCSEGHCMCSEPEYALEAGATAEKHE